jgi:hypothetical protein
MASQPNVINQLINPLQVQTFQRYLPTAFDEGMTLLEKVNKIIITLNQIGKLSNDVLDQWNQVMDWVMADGLDASIDSKIDSMLQDGSLATIIGNAITDLGTQMTALQATVTQNKTDMEAEIATNKTTLETEMTNTINTVNALLYYATPEQYGAKGDGITDDTTAIQNCMNAAQITAFSAKRYLISSPLILPQNHSIQGNHGELFIGNTWTGNSTIGASVPANTVLYITARDPIYNSELDMRSAHVKDLRIRGNASMSLTGLYLGMKDRSTLTAVSTVNTSVFGYKFDNVGVSYCSDGFHISEAWQCVFDACWTEHIKNNACSITGQSVNNTFTACSFDTTADGSYGLWVDQASYGGPNYRPEGNSFIGGFIGQAQVGVRLNTGLAIKFTNCIIDLNTTNGVIAYESDDCTFVGCYIYASGAVIVNIADNASSSNGVYLVFDHCNLVSSNADSTQASIVGANQTGVIFSGCLMMGRMTIASGAKVTVKDCYWNQNDEANMITLIAGGTLHNMDNYFKNTGTTI